ncbi:hypothetical protein AAFF_G00113860 [Aldrovandia affinis]|uniref:Uncharacterized protein n=1 Tax=Aldrovandia affinis TaxID=143900 RepID=A0AAD7RTF5_9TELE|nr:hypothetical protein AAFF_G00113860 [Aldrovandia affinis]
MLFGAGPSLAGQGTRCHPTKGEVGGRGRSEAWRVTGKAVVLVKSTCRLLPGRLRHRTLPFPPSSSGPLINPASSGWEWRRAAGGCQRAEETEECRPQGEGEGY